VGSGFSTITIATPNWNTIFRKTANLRIFSLGAFVWEGRAALELNGLSELRVTEGKIKDTGSTAKKYNGLGQQLNKLRCNVCERQALVLVQCLLTVCNGGQKCCGG
jgi:hypothetical protein